jgi:hypothetical protein
MGRFIQDSDTHGSQKDLQILINEKKDLLDKEISDILNRKIDITWKSPLKTDQFAEYRDNEFLRILNLDPKIVVPLEEFWPRLGPQWDALGSEGKTVFLVEAKANVPEIVTPPTDAGPESKSKILDSFAEVKEYLNVNNQIDWSGTFYQYANRIAHLYYLRVLNGFDAYLVNIYFLNDKSVDGPATKDEWQGAITVIKQYLGIPKNHKLDKYMLDAFVDTKDL